MVLTLTTNTTNHLEKAKDKNKMKIIARAPENKERILVPEGNHVARCIQMIHTGTISVSYADGDKQQDKVRIGWELPNEKAIFDKEKGEQPFVISKNYTLSMFKDGSRSSALVKDLQSWRGRSFTEEELKEFDIVKVLGAPCLLNIVHETSKKGEKFAKVESIATLPKGMECPPQVNPTVLYSVLEHDQEVFDTLPKFLQEVIMGSKEWKEWLQNQEEEISIDDL